MLSNSSAPPADVSCPIVVVHTGEKDYLELCLRQLRKSNPNARIFLLGDFPDERFPFVENRLIADPALSVDVADFHAVFQHFGRDNFYAERFCIERWFYIRNLMREENLDRVLAIDSDVLLFCDAAKEAARFQDFELVCSRWDSRRRLPHFVNSRSVLERFCAFTLDVYRDARLLEEVKEANRKKFNFYWISDMALWAAWGDRANAKTAYFDEYYEKGVFFDSSIYNVKDFRSAFSYFPFAARRYKKIFFRDGKPWGATRSGVKAPFLCLHYHGYFKFLMQEHFLGRHSEWRTALFLLRRKLKTLPQKIRNNVRKYARTR